MVLTLLLIAGLMSGSVLHAMESAGNQEVTAATIWLHSDGDHDEVPADADKNYPHHHNQCQGHDIAAPLKACAVPTTVPAPAKLIPARAVTLTAASPAELLRPPRA